MPVGLLRTTDSVTPLLSGTEVLLSLASYGLVYLVMFPSGFLLMARIISKGPIGGEAPESVAKAMPLSGSGSKP